MRMLARRAGLWMAGEPMYAYPHASNLLLYVDQRKDPTIRKILDLIKLRLRKYGVNHSIFDLTGPKIVA